MGFEDPEIGLSEKKDVISLAGLCGVDSNELITMLTENTLTKEAAYAKASEVAHPTKFWGKLLHKLDYITPSYYVKKYETIDKYIEKNPELKERLEQARAELDEYMKNYYNENEYYEEYDEIEKIKNEIDEIKDEAYKQALASVYLTNSLNQSIAQKAANMITYGKLFYYDNEKLGSIKDRKTGKSKDVADGFAEGWYKIATHQFYKDTPAAKLAQEAILNSGRREYQDKEFAKAISEVRFLDNAKKDSEFILFAMDFIDPIMAIAPLAGSKKAATLIDKAVTTAKNTKVGRATENVLRPVTQVVGKVGDDITEAMGKGMGVKGYGGNHFGMVGDAANAGKRVGQGADALTDVGQVVNHADDVRDATKGAKEVTAMNPETVNKSLTGDVDNLVTESQLKDLHRQRVNQRYAYANGGNKYPSKYSELDKNLYGAKNVQILDNGYVKVTKVDGTTTRVKMEDFKLWVEGIPDVPGTGISQAERNLMNYDDVVQEMNRAQEVKAAAAAAENTARELSKDFVRQYSSQINTMNKKMNAFTNSVNQGCSSPDVCKNLLDWLSDWRKEFNNLENELLTAYRKTNPQATIQDLRNMLKNQPDSFAQGMLDLFNGKNTDLASFLKGEPLKLKGFDFNKISNSLVDYVDLDDAINFLKGTDNSYFEPLKVIAGPEDMASLTNKVRDNLIKRREFFQSHYDLLNTRVQNAMKARNLTPADKDYKKIYKYIVNNWIKENKHNFPHFRKGDDVLKIWEDVLNKINSVL